jgi:acetyl esterase/lipase
MVHRPQIGALCAAALLLAVQRPPALGDVNGVTILRNIRYGHAGNQILRLDAYLPPGRGFDRPALLYVHGGSWVGGDKKGYRSLAIALAQEGYVGFSVNYRLATKKHNKWPAQLDDVQRAVRWIRAHSLAWGVDPNRLGAVGESAGGHLVAMLGVTDTRDNSDLKLASYSSRVSCVVDCYGPADFSITPADKETAEARRIHVLVFGYTRQQAPQIFYEASPVNHVDSKAAPFLIFHGTDDHTVHLAQSARLYQVLRKAGIDATFIQMPKDGHGFHIKENQQLFSAMLRHFLAIHLKKPAAAAGQTAAIRPTAAARAAA